VEREEDNKEFVSLLIKIDRQIKKAEKYLESKINSEYWNFVLKSLFLFRIDVLECLRRIEDKAFTSLKDGKGCVVVSLDDIKSVLDVKMKDDEVAKKEFGIDDYTEKLNKVCSSVVFVSLFKKKHTFFNALTGEKSYEFFIYDDVMESLRRFEKEFRKTMLKEFHFHNVKGFAKYEKLLKRDLKRFFGDMKK